MRCDQCNKFVSFDTDVEPEVNIDCDEEGNVRGDVRIVNACAECGSEMTEATFEIDEDFAQDVKDHRASCKTCKRKSIEADADLSRCDEFQTKDRHGKVIKNPRYQKHLYGVEGSITITMECGATYTTTYDDQIEASGMEGLM